MSFCTECGSKLPENAQFCTNCGTRLKAVSASSDEAADEIELNEGPDSAQPDEQASASESGGGFVPPYTPGAYGFAPPPSVSSASPKKSGGKIALIVILSIVGLVALALILIFALGSDEPSNELVGYWESSEIDFGNGVFVEQYHGIETAGLIGIQINSDGTMYLGSALNEDICSGSWSMSGSRISATLNGQSVYVSLDKDHLLLLDGDMAVSFERSARDINSPSIPFGLYADGGNWVLQHEHEHEYASGGASVAGSGDVSNGKFHVAVVGAEKIADINGNAGIRIYYEFTNSFDYAVSAFDALDFELMQDGKALSPTYSWDENEPEYYNYELNIRPGITILCSCEYGADFSGGSLDFTVFGWDTGKGGGTVTATYSPDSLPGRPAYYEIEPVTDPKWTLGIPESGTLDEHYDVSVGNAELIEDAFGDAALRVYYTFKNNSAAPACLTRVLYCRAYQDGVSLDESYAIEENDSDSLAYTEIKSGESIDCSIVYRLRNSDSPVEAEVEASQTYDAVGQTYNIK